MPLLFVIVEPTSIVGVGVIVVVVILWSRGPAPGGGPLEVPRIGVETLVGEAGGQGVSPHCLLPLRPRDH